MWLTVSLMFKASSDPQGIVLKETREVEPMGSNATLHLVAVFRCGCDCCCRFESAGCALSPRCSKRETSAILFNTLTTLCCTGLATVPWPTTALWRGFYVPQCCHIGSFQSVLSRYIRRCRCVPLILPVLWFMPRNTWQTGPAPLKAAAGIQKCLAAMRHG